MIPQRRPRHTVIVLVGAACLTTFAAYPTPAYAYDRPGRTERVSVSSTGAEANGGSAYLNAISADGTVIAFASIANNLVPGDTNGTWDVFVRDLATGVTERVSVSTDGSEANGLSAHPSISADGRYVAFSSGASNLVAGDTNGFGDVFVHDRETGATTRVSLAHDGTEGNGNSGNFGPSLSADGRYVTYSSTASNLVPGDTNGGDVQWDQDAFVYDRETGEVERVSVASDGTQTNARARSIAETISADGRYVAFSSNAANLVDGDANGVYDLFLHDRSTGRTERISVSSHGVEGNNHSQSAALSTDGRYVAFSSDASNLVPSDTNGTWDVFVHDRSTGVTERVSVAGSGAEGQGGSGPPRLNSTSPRISADGRFVLFQSAAPNLVPGDSNEMRDVFVHDRVTGLTERVSVADDGAQSNGNSSALYSAMTPDARYVAFDSDASNLVPSDTNGFLDVFVRDRGPATGVGDVRAELVGDRIAVSGWATFAGQVASAATDAAGDGATGAKERGAELTGAAVAYRPEGEDLLLRWSLAALPSGRESCLIDQPVELCEEGGGAPGSAAPGELYQRLLYGMAFELGGIRYEVRARTGSSLRVDDQTVTDPPHFALFRCDPTCAEEAALEGGIGASGDEVRVAVPHSTLGIAEGSTLTLTRAYTETESTTLQPGRAYDEIELSAGILPSTRVRLGIAPAGTPEDLVRFDTAATLANGVFDGDLGVSSLPTGDYEVWARACLGDTCGAASTRIVLGSG